MGIGNLQSVCAPMCRPKYFSRILIPPVPPAGLVVITSTPPMMWLVNDPLKEASAVALASIAVFMGGFSASACGPSIRWVICC